MRQETNNELDLLLRRLSRRQGMPASDADSNHLDADELSSYAENVLPAPARARYTEHLAECSKCRELVVQLSGSIPVVAAKESLTAAGASGLRKFLANFFSPMVLRYAVPTLGLIVVAAVGVVVLRSRQPETFVAQLEKSPQPNSQAISNQQPQPSEPVLETKARRESQSPPAAPQVLRDSASMDQSAPAPPNAAPVVGSVRVEPKIDASASKAEVQAVANAAPTPAPEAPKPAETVDEMRIQVEGRKGKAQARVAQGSGVAKENYESLPVEKKKTDEISTLRPGAAPAADSRARGGGTGAMQSREESEKDRQDGETRSLSGRRFRKQGGVWVDTAYVSGSATTNIKRGSEQYRALVADEPAIKTIAEQLEGQIVVVWNGRAYRIR